MDEKRENVPSDKKRNSSKTAHPLFALSLMMEISVTMLINVLIGFFIGLYLDRWFNTSVIFLLVFTVLGVISGFRMAYLLIMKVIGR